MCAQLCPVLCDPMDCNPPGSFVHEFLQARILEWVAISYSCLFIVYPVIHSFPKKSREEDNYKDLTWSILAKGKSQIQFSSVQFSHSVVSDSLWPNEPRTPGLPVHHQLLDSTQIHVHRVDDAIQPSHPLSSPSPPALNLSQCQGLFKWVSSSNQVAKLLEFQLQHQSFQWTPRTDLL